MCRLPVLRPRIPGLSQHDVARSCSELRGSRTTKTLVTLALKATPSRKTRLSPTDANVCDSTCGAGTMLHVSVAVELSATWLHSVQVSHTSSRPCRHARQTGNGPRGATNDYFNNFVLDIVFPDRLSARFLYLGKHENTPSGRQEAGRRVYVVLT